MANIAFKRTTMSAEYALEEFIYRICKDLNIRDLGRIARVCKLWNQVAKREIELRRFQRIMLYIGHNVPFHCSLRVKPYVALMFVPLNLDEFDIKEMAEVCSQFVDLFPNKLVILGAKKIFTEKNFHDTDEYDEDRSFGLYNKSEVPCLIIPNNKNLEVKTAKCTREALNLNTNRIIEKLVPTNKEFKTILFMFTFHPEDNGLEKLTKSVKKKFSGCNYTLWGSELRMIPFLQDAERKRQDMRMFGFLGISISSPDIDTYSTIISCEDWKLSSFNQDLEKFRSIVKLKKHSMALITAPAFEDYAADTSDEEDGKEMRREMDEFYTNDYEKCFLFHFKKLFPNVYITAVLQDNTSKTYGIDTSNGSNKSLMHQEAVNVLIVTYN